MLWVDSRTVTHKSHHKIMSMCVVFGVLRNPHTSLWLFRMATSRLCPTPGARDEKCNSHNTVDCDNVRRRSTRMLRNIGSEWDEPKYVAAGCLASTAAPCAARENPTAVSFFSHCRPHHVLLLGNRRYVAKKSSYCGAQGRPRPILVLSQHAHSINPRIKLWRDFDHRVDKSECAIGQNPTSCDQQNLALPIGCPTTKTGRHHEGYDSMCSRTSLRDRVVQECSSHSRRDFPKASSCYFLARATGSAAQLLRCPRQMRMCQSRLLPFEATDQSCHLRRRGGLGAPPPSTPTGAAVGVRVVGSPSRWYGGGGLDIPGVEVVSPPAAMAAAAAAAAESTAAEATAAPVTAATTAVVPSDAALTRAARRMGGGHRKTYGGQRKAAGVGTPVAGTPPRHVTPVAAPPTGGTFRRGGGCVPPAATRRCGAQSRPPGGGSDGWRTPAGAARVGAALEGCNPTSDIDAAPAAARVAVDGRQTTHRLSLARVSGGWDGLTDITRGGRRPLWRQRQGLPPRERVLGFFWAATRRGAADASPPARNLPWTPSERKWSEGGGTGRVRNTQDGCLVWGGGVGTMRRTRAVDDRGGGGGVPRDTQGPGQRCTGWQIDDAVVGMHWPLQSRFSDLEERPYPVYPSSVLRRARHTSSSRTSPTPPPAPPQPHDRPECAAELVSRRPDDGVSVVTDESAVSRNASGMGGGRVGRTQPPAAGGGPTSDGRGEGSTPLLPPSPPPPPSAAASVPATGAPLPVALAVPPPPRRRRCRTTMMATTRAAVSAAAATAAATAMPAAAAPDTPAVSLSPPPRGWTQPGSPPPPPTTRRGGAANTQSMVPVVSVVVTTTRERFPPPISTRDTSVPSVTSRNQSDSPKAAHWVGAQAEADNVRPVGHAPRPIVGEHQRLGRVGLLDRRHNRRVVRGKRRDGDEAAARARGAVFGQAAGSGEAHGNVSVGAADTTDLRKRFGGGEGQRFRARGRRAAAEGAGVGARQVDRAHAHNVDNGGGTEGGGGPRRCGEGAGEEGGGGGGRRRGGHDGARHPPGRGHGGSKPGHFDRHVEQMRAVLVAFSATGYCSRGTFPIDE
ncbi:LOW QUALITY PROTEIN: hypothetical protein BU14_0147s0030 [Porphyra umbilicalis]|uniref:Uncharacterized protein n=1 Tax=Porphyra umbilicalis TaxID=2786 RepID=A0A1X6P9V2_PORUM|nr:LOW QUALITY PROTEIN: hypothetical protein BU14_0147s0030 [Porphyra umbilicalis]|eukprot:OSX77505.1 LOW QUALITY PROTEIN: hypothetical protein BU14_0147s0030 [Porphyra umbilicalis]